MGKQPKLVKEIPKGYEFSHKDTVTGKDIYKISSSKSTPEGGHGRIRTDDKKPTVTKSVNKKPNTILPKSKTRQSSTIIPPTVNPTEDYVMLEDVITETPSVQKVQSLRTDLKRESPSGLQEGYSQYSVPDLTTGGNYTNAKSVIVDNEDYPVQFDFKTNKYIRTGEGKLHSTMPVQNDTPTIQDALKPNELPTKFDAIPERLRAPNYNKAKVTTPTIDTSIYKGFNEVAAPNETKSDAEFNKEQEKNLAIPKLNKGGIVSKIKGYTNGGTTRTTISGLEAGVVGQNDQYSAQKAKEDQDAIDEEKKKANQQKARNVANGIGEGMGGVGSAYYNSQPTQNEGEATRNAGLAATSQMGGIGGMIGGLAAMGDKIGKPIKNKSEALDSSGNLKNSNKSKMNAIGGSLFSPSKALAYRSESGNWGDVTGNQYNAFIEGKAKAQLAEVKDANAKAAQQQAILARNNQEENPTITNPYNLTGVTFDENQNMVLADGQQFDKNRPMMNKGGLVGKVKQMCSEGGEIKGKGTAKSDSIEAEVKEDSFVVPAENAELAKGIRKLYLKAPNKKANLKQEEGEPVKLSNGEHLFTPEENEYLESIGIELEDLAPNAEEGNKKADGGPVKGTKVDGATWDGKNWVSADGSKYSSEGGKKFTDKYNQSVAKEKSNQEQKTASEINLYSRKLKEATDSGNTEEAKRLQAKINQLSGTNKTDAKTDATETSKTRTTVKPSLKAPKVTPKSEVGKFVPTLTPDTGEEVVVPGDKLSPNERAIANADAEKATVQAAALNKSLPQTVSTNGTPQNQRRGLADVIGSVDPTAFVGIGQTALGLNMLGKEKRPIDKAKIDPTYNTAVNRAQQDAQFGLTPEQKFMAEQDIQGGLNDAKMAGLNASGVQSFNLNRAAINDAWKNKLGLKQADAEMRMNKQKYADSMAADRAGILSANRRQAFNDAMYTFQQKQQAGSELIGAGLANTIGAYRFKKDQQARDEANKASNAWTTKI